MKISITIAFTVFASVLFNACQPSEPSDKVALSQENTKLFNDLREYKIANEKKDSSLQEALTLFNEIEKNLAEIKQREGVISMNYESGEGQDRKDAIIQDIQIINSLLEANKGKIQKLNQLIKQKDLKVQELSEMSKRLTGEIALKDKEIHALKNQLSSLKIDYKVLSMRSMEQQELIEMQEIELATAYYCFGTEKELINNNVITKEGGFIGIGKSEKLANNFNRGYFTQIDIHHTTEIPLMVKKVEMLTPHADVSYVLVEEDGIFKKLIIKDPYLFWEASKFLVLITS